MAPPLPASAAEIPQILTRASSAFLRLDVDKSGALELAELVQFCGDATGAAEMMADLVRRNKPGARVG